MTIKYLDGFPESTFFRAADEKPPGIDPNHIAFVNNKYYLGGVEIPAEQGSELLDKAMKEGKNYTIFYPIRRN